MQNLTKTRERVADLLVSSCGLNRKDALATTKEIEAVLLSVLMEDEAVSLKGIGTIVVAHTKEKLGRNPQTGEALVIPAHKMLKFKAEASIKKRLREALA